MEKIMMRVFLCPVMPDRSNVILGPLPDRGEPSGRGVDEVFLHFLVCHSRSNRESKPKKLSCSSEANHLDTGVSAVFLPFAKEIKKGFFIFYTGLDPDPSLVLSPLEGES